MSIGLKTNIANLPFNLIAIFLMEKRLPTTTYVCLYRITRTRNLRESAANYLTISYIERVPAGDKVYIYYLRCTNLISDVI